MQKYKESLASLCMHSAKLSVMEQQLKKGERVDTAELSDELKKLSNAKRVFLEEKERLGYTDGLAFMENNAFAGFRIVNGSVVGDTSLLLKIVSPWYDNFPNAGNNYRYEVAVFLASHYIYINDMYDDSGTMRSKITQPRLHFIVSVIKNKIIHLHKKCARVFSSAFLLRRR